MMYMGYITEGLLNYLILFVFLAAIELVICHDYKKNRVKVQKGFLIGWQVFACFIIGILSITGVPGIQELWKNGVFSTGITINLIPFQLGEGSAFGLIMNVILFVPIGLFVPLLFKRGRRLRRTMMIGIIFSLLIETSQLFNFRATDIDDLITNTLGTAIGYGIYHVLLLKCRKLQVKNDRGTWGVKQSALVTVMSILIFYFFIGSPVLDNVKGIIYGG